MAAHGPLRCADVMLKNDGQNTSQWASSVGGCIHEAAVVLGFTAGGMVALPCTTCMVANRGQNAHAALGRAITLGGLGSMQALCVEPYKNTAFLGGVRGEITPSLT